MTLSSAMLSTHPLPTPGRHFVSSDLTIALRRGDCPHIRNGGHWASDRLAERDSVPGQYLQSPTPLPYGGAIRRPRVAGARGCAGGSRLPFQRESGEGGSSSLAWTTARKACVHSLGPCVCDNGPLSLFRTCLSSLVPSESQFLRRRTGAIVSRSRFLALGSGFCTQGHSMGGLDRLAQACLPP